jgi:hypothetical protein
VARLYRVSPIILHKNRPIEMWKLFLTLKTDIQVIRELD